MAAQNSSSARTGRQLAELIENKNYRQALSLCEKKLKKDPSQELLITKISILIFHPDEVRRLQGQRELDEVLNRSIPISNLQQLLIIYETTRDAGIVDPRINDIWERALSIRPEAEDLYLTWFRLAFIEARYKSAQKASMMYMKRFPYRREPYFWNIISCQIAGDDPNVSESEKAVFKQLAYAFLSKAAINTSADGKKSSGARTLENLDELLLLLKVYRSQSKYLEALAILNDHGTGIKSSIGKNSWDLVREKIDLCDLCSRWEELWKFCCELLEDAVLAHQSQRSPPYHQFGQFGNDWIVWNGLVTANHKINNTNNNTRTISMIELCLKSQNNSRNARLALVKHYALGPPQDAEAEDSLLSTCTRYFVDFSFKTACFSDLQPFITRLERLKKRSLLRFISLELQRYFKESKHTAVDWLTSEINALKLDFFLVISHHSNLHNKKLICSFIENSLRLYKLSQPLGSELPPSERHPGDDAAILAAMALVHLFHLETDKGAILRAVFVLEYLTSRPNFNYDALVILTRLHVLLGSGSLAVERYLQLSIKNIQYATLSWILYTRISSIYPAKFIISKRSKTPLDLPKNLSQGLTWYQSALRQNDDFILKALEGGHYSSLLNLLSVNESIKTTSSRYMLFYEHRRISRLTMSPEVEDPTDSLGKNTFLQQLTDTRDTSAFPDYEAATQGQFIDYLTCGPQLTKYWLSSQIRINELWTLIQQKNKQSNQALANCLPRKWDNEMDGLTCAEYHTDRTVQILHSLASPFSFFKNKAEQAKAYAEPSLSLLTDLDEIFDRVVRGWKTQLEEMSSYPLFPEFAIPNWEYLHTIIQRLEECKLIVATLDYLSSENAKVQVFDPAVFIKKSACIKENITSITADIHNHAWTMQQRLRSKGVVDTFLHHMFDDPNEGEPGVGSELLRLIDLAKMEETASDIFASWINALDTVIQLSKA